MKDEILRAVGAFTVVVILLSGGWSIASATISMNSTAGADTLKLLKIMPSSGETVNVSTTFVINATSGDVVKMGDFKLSTPLVMNFSDEDFYNQYGLMLYGSQLSGNTLIYAIQTGQSDAGYFQRNNATGDRPVVRVVKLNESDEQPALRVSCEDSNDQRCFEIYDEGNTIKFRVNSTGDITKMGKFTNDLVIKAPDQYAEISFQNSTGDNKVSFHYNNNTDEMVFWDAGIGAMFSINMSNGDITKMGKFTQNVEIAKADPVLIINDTAGNLANARLRFDQAGESRYSWYAIDGNQLAFRDEVGGYNLLEFSISADTITANGSIIPATNNTQDLGSSTKWWNEAYIDTGYVGDLVFSNDWRIAEGENVGLGSGLVWIDENDNKKMWLDRNGTLHVAGGVDTDWVPQV